LERHAAPVQVGAKGFDLFHSLVVRGQEASAF
jgi:hypothetical protein